MTRAGLNDFLETANALRSVGVSVSIDDAGRDPFRLLNAPAFEAKRRPGR